MKAEEQTICHQINNFFRYKACHNTNLNGYNFGPGAIPNGQGMVWHLITDHDKSLENVEMAIKGKAKTKKLFI